MRRCGLGLVRVALLVALAAAPVAAALPVGTSTRVFVPVGTSTRVFVKPASGGPRTTFKLSFRIPDATGTSGFLRRSDALTVTGPQRRGCISRAAFTLRSAPRNSRLRITLSPFRLHGSWCPGAFHGAIVESQIVVCPLLMVCPNFVIAPRTIARFRFHVKRRPVAGSGPPAPPPVQGPTFGGLVSATACTGLPVLILPRPAAYVLAWQPATDPVTPSSGIFYDVYAATLPGGENYAKPTWITPVGVTSYTTPNAVLYRPDYFVVRARDAAGLEDQNTVERQGVAECRQGATASRGR